MKFLEKVLCKEWKGAPVFANPTEGFCFESDRVHVLRTVFCHENGTTDQ